jgi:hypothetical protein
MQELALPQRTLRTTFWLATLFVIVFGLRGQATVSVGLAIGSAIGLFSLWSLTVLVPRLVRVNNDFAKFGLGITMILKIPLYAVVLAYAMVSPSVHPFAVFVGVALVPAVITLKVLTAPLLERINAQVGGDPCPSRTPVSG